MSEESDHPKLGDFGTDESIPPVEEEPYKIIFEVNKYFGAGRYAKVVDSWEMDLETDLARAKSYFISEDELGENVKAAEVCSAKKGRGVIHAVNRRTDEGPSPDPHGDGTFSVD